MNKKIATEIVIGVITIIVMIIGGFFWLQSQTRLNIDENSLNNNKNQPIKKSEETADWQTYQNNEYGFKIKYPKEWHYKEYDPKPVNVSYRLLDTSTKKYKYHNVNEMTNYYVGFSANEDSTKFGYIQVEIFNGTMEDMFNRMISRSDYYNSLIRQGKKNIEDVRKEFWGEKIILNQIDGFKVVGRGRIPDALNDYPIEVIYIEKDNKVIMIIMANKNNIAEINTIYRDMVSSFKLIK